jgi:hypothetical protein
MNLVHCDISPPNVLVSFEGETKVIDFGIAKSAMRGTATDPKMGFGKFGYMAPEQLIRGGIVDHRTDIYAAGVVLYEVLTGQRLYEAGPEPDYRALAKKVARGEHTMPSEIEPSLAPYDDLVATALRPKSDDRYQSAAEFRDAIQQALVAVNPTISTDQLGSFMRELFSEEMSAQRELNDRIANAHLSEFQEAFHTQTISTVSFAIAQLPLPAPADIAQSARVSAQHAAVRARLSGPQPAIRPSPALDTVSPPTASMSSEDLATLSALADGTGTSVRSLEKPQPRDRRALYAVIATLAVALVVLLGFALRGGSRNEPVAAIEPPAKKDVITVEPIEPVDVKAQAGSGSAGSGSAGSGSAAVEIQMNPEPVGSGSAKEPARPHRPRVRPPTAGSDAAKPDLTPKVDTATIDTVTNKFMQAQRLYREYREKNGGRLEKEFTDLMTYVQYDKASPADRLKRIESFIGKMRE